MKQLKVKRYEYIQKKTPPDGIKYQEILECLVSWQWVVSKRPVVVKIGKVDRYDLDNKHINQSISFLMLFLRRNNL